MSFSVVSESTEKFSFFAEKFSEITRIPFNQQFWDTLHGILSMPMHKKCSQVSATIKPYLCSLPSSPYLQVQELSNILLMEVLQNK